MSIWRIERKKHPNWDEYSDFVIVASSEDEVRKLAHQKAGEYILEFTVDEPEAYAGHYCHEFLRPEAHTLTYLGDYVGEKDSPFIVCESFHAG